MNDLFLKALRCQNRGRPPIWLMRQAGRYMPEYRAYRERYSFLELCHHPELIAEITQLPIKIFHFDAAILFSDILVIPEAMGVGLHFDEGIGPVIERPIQTDRDIEELPEVGSLDFVTEGIRLLKPQLKVPLIGFCGAPFTLASYMIEGKGTKEFKKTKDWLFRKPETFHQLLNKLTDAAIDFLKMQIKAGVDAIQIFDSWVHVLAHPQFCEFSLAYLRKIVDALRSFDIPIILFCRGSSVFAEDLAKARPSGISVDWNGSLMQLRKRIPSSIALQGNLDPAVLLADRTTLHNETARLLDEMKGDPGYIFNLGHGILPETPVDNVKELVSQIAEAR